MSATPRPPRWRKVLRQVGPPVLVFALFIGLWFLVSYVMLDPRRRFLLPPPHDVVDVAFLDQRNLTEVLNALWLTTVVALVGLALSIVLGVVAGILMSQARWVEQSFYPYAVVLQTIPVLALVPLIGFWFGFDFQSRVTVVVMFSLFPIITNTLFGVKSVTSGYHDLFTLSGASRVARLFRLEIPAASPAIFTGFRISAGLAVIGAIVGDFFFRQGKPGIGRLLDVYAQRLETEQLFAAIFLSSILGLVVFWGFGLLSQRVLGSWHESAKH